MSKLPINPALKNVEVHLNPLKLLATKKKTRPRQDNSLGVLTKKFVKLIKEAPDQIIDLNQVV